MAYALRAYRRAGAGKAVLDPVATHSVVCTVEVKGAPAEAPPPPFGDVDAHVVYTEGGASGDGCSCPAVDSLTMRPKARIDALARPAYVVAWFGTDEEEARAIRDPDVLFGSWMNDPQRGFEVTLGVADGHERTGVGFGREGRYCFALAWMDAVGRIGERSPSTCLDTKDAKDPTVTVEDEGFCLCTSVGSSRRLGTGGVTFFVLAFGVVIARRALARRRS